MRIWNISLTLIAIFFIAFLIFIGASFVYMSSSYFCANCHVMSTQYISWRRSLHSDVPCMKCHSEPGLVGDIKAHLLGSKRLFMHITGLYSRQEIIAEVKDASCQTCHKNINENEDRAKNVHLAHNKIKIDCVTCHAGLVHGDIGGGFRYEEYIYRRCHPKLAETESEAEAAK